MDTQAWYDNLAEPIKRVFDRTVEYLPAIAGALVLVLIGWLLGRLLGFIARRLTLYGLKRLGRTSTFEAGLEQQAKFRTAPVLVSAIVFWTVFLFFLAAGVEALGLQAVSEFFASALTYLPRILVGAAIFFAGILLGDVTRRWALRAATRAGVPRAETIGRGVQVLVVAVAVLIAVDQIGVESGVLILVLGIVAGSVFAATALAFGLGAGATVSNILAAHELLRTYEIGQSVKIGDLQGSIVEITRTAVILESPEGRIHVPARRFSEEASVLLSREAGA